MHFTKTTVFGVLTVAVLTSRGASAGSITIGTTSAGATYVAGTYTCSVSSCTIAASDLQTQLTTTDVTVVSSGGGDITVNATVTWGSARVLTLQAADSIAINALLTGSGLVLRADAACASAGGITASADTLDIDTEVVAYAHDTVNLTTALASGTAVAYQLIDTMSELANMGVTGNYALGCDIADPVSGYVPVGSSTTPFKGTLDGLGHAIIDAAVEGTSNVGIFGVIEEATLRNVLLIRPSVTATGTNVGALAGSAIESTINDVAVLDANVEGAVRVGGLLGNQASGTTTRVYSTGRIGSATASEVGGIVGHIDNNGGGLFAVTGTLSEAASKARITATSKAGGLVGTAAALTSILRSWSAGAVNATTDAGGAIGQTTSSILPAGTTVTNVFWDTQTSGKATSGTSNGAAAASGALTTAQSRQQASYTGFDFTSTWGIRGDVGRPFLQSLLAPLDIAVQVATSGPTVASEPATYTATLVPATAYGTVVGIVLFLDGAAELSSATIASDTAVLTTPDTSVGSRTITGYFTGDDYHLENTGTVSQTVTKASSTTTITIEGGVLRATVSAVAPATATPSGQATFVVDSVALTPLNLTNGVASLNPSTLSVGEHDVMVTYEGDASFIGSSSTTIDIEVHGPTSTTLTADASTTSYGAALGLSVVVTSISSTPTGSVRFLADGTTELGEIALVDGSAALTVASLTAGTHTLSAHFLPSDETFTASISNDVTHEVTQAASATVVTIDSASDGVVTVRATVASVPETLGHPTGNVVFVLDDVEIAQAGLVDGSATFTTARLASGTHNVSCRYSGDTNYTTSTSETLPFDVTLAGFRIAAAPSSAQVLVGGSAPFTLNLAAEGQSFDEEVKLSCGDLPTGTTCTFSPESTGIDAQGAVVSLVITTQTPAAAGSTTMHLPPAVGPGLAFTLATLMAIAAMLTTLKRTLRLGALGGALLCVAIACNDDPVKLEAREGTEPGVYSITIHATSEHYTRDVAVELTVQ